MSITQAAFDGVCMQNLDLKRQNQAMKEALGDLVKEINSRGLAKNVKKDFSLMNYMVQAEKALTLTNGEKVEDITHLINQVRHLHD